VDTLTRRRFLVASGVTGAGALAGGAGMVGWSQLANARHRAATVEQPGGRTLVLVTLYGGNDGLATVIPASDPAYQDARADLAYQSGEVLDLSDGLGLNPSMKGLHGLWRRGRLAIVRGVGYPRPDRSHFRSMAIWQTADPVSPPKTGWLGRWLDATGGDPLRAVSIGQVLPPLLAGERTAGAVLPLGGLAVGRSVEAGCRALATAAPGEPSAVAAVRTSIRDLLRCTEALSINGGSDEHEPDDRKSGGGSAGGQQALGAQLSLVGRLIKAGVPTRVYATSLGGFDTHADQKDAQSALLGEVDEAVTAFLSNLEGSRGGDGVVVAIYSEFGRRVRANAAQGTDHGTAGPVLIAGARVRGGFYGDQPSLSSLDDGDLAVTTDFRDVYATLLEEVLGAEVGPVLGEWRRRVPLL